MSKKFVTFLLALLLLVSTEYVCKAETSLNWRGNSFYKTDEDRYEKAKSQEEIEEEENEKRRANRSVSDIIRNIKLEIASSSGINDINNKVGGNKGGISFGGSATGDLINAGDGKFYSGTLALLNFTGESRGDFNTTQFIEMIAPIAMELGPKYSVFPSVIIANAAEETGWGNSSLIRDCNNMGGVKAYSSWKGPLSSSTAPSSEDSAYYRGYESINAAVEDKLAILQQDRYNIIREAKTAQNAVKFYETGYAGNPGKDINVLSILNYKGNNLEQYDVEYKALLSQGKIKHTPKSRDDIKNNNYFN
ncbi:glucosaminidase domain-containing protein [Clostridium tertium]|uniref:glucosaminidase domain-containing protein n=1 Tax=Clostridium tertium TaxID=1559 RepID=UPI0023B21AB9|nr:glucosaminidase domain-containing protein [Clostridium tertium]